MRMHMHVVPPFTRSDPYLRYGPALTRLFSGPLFYCTTPMPNWRVEKHLELAYGRASVLFRLNVLVQCNRKKGIH